MSINKRLSDIEATIRETHGNQAVQAILDRHDLSLFDGELTVLKARFEGLAADEQTTLQKHVPVTVLHFEYPDGMAWDFAPVNDLNN